MEGKEAKQEFISLEEVKAMVLGNITDEKDQTNLISVIELGLKHSHVFEIINEDGNAKYSGPVYTDFDDEKEDEQYFCFTRTDC